MDLYCTSQLSQTEGIKALIYGQAGIGKTSLIPTCEAPIIISAEKGLESISNHQIPYFIVNSWADFINALHYLYSNQGQFKTIVVDSLSQISSMLFNEQKRVCLTRSGAPDTLAAYRVVGEMMREVIDLWFRQYLAQYHIVAFAKLDKTEDDTQKIMYAPLFVGKATGLEAVHAFDLVGAMRQKPDKSRYIMTESDGMWQAKHRSPYPIGGEHEPHIANLFNKIRGVQ